MENLFWIIIKNSIAAGGVALLLALLRMIFRKAPRRMFVMLWGLVAIRLLLPFSFETRFGLMPDFGGDNIRTESAAGGPEQEASNQTVSEAAVQHPEKAAADASAAQTGAAAQTGGIATGQSAAEHGGNIMLQQKARKSDTDWMGIASVVWLGGVALMLLYAAADYVRLRFRVREAIRFKGNIWRSDRISTPFILGLLRPRIYLPSGLDETDRIYVVAHERMHQRRRDPLRKMTGFVLLSFFWFQPLIWLAYVLFCRDIEYACDEAVLERIGKDGKKPYAEALINCSTMHRPRVVSPLSFAEASVKRRIMNVLRYRKAPTWMTCLLVAFGLLLSGCFMTERKAEEPAAAETSAQENVPVDAASLPKESATDEPETGQGAATDLLKTEPVTSINKQDFKQVQEENKQEQQIQEVNAGGKPSDEMTDAMDIPEQTTIQEESETTPDAAETNDHISDDEPDDTKDAAPESTEESVTEMETTQATERLVDSICVIPGNEDIGYDSERVFYEDEDYYYWIAEEYWYLWQVIYSDGSTEEVRDAFMAGRIGLSDLDRFDVPYYGKSKVERQKPDAETLSEIRKAIEGFFSEQYPECTVLEITFLEYYGENLRFEIEFDTGVGPDDPEYSQYDEMELYVSKMDEVLWRVGELPF